MEKLVSRQLHELKVVGAEPTSAPNIAVYQHFKRHRVYTHEYGLWAFETSLKTKVTLMYKSQNYIYSYPDENGCQPFGTRL